MATKPPALGDSFEEAAQNPLPVKQTLWERLNTGSGIPMVDETLKRDVMQKQAQANLYHQNASQLNGLLLHLRTPEGKGYINPQTSQPYTDDDIAQLEMQRDHAWGQYEKLVGIDKQSKAALQKAKSIIDFIHGSAGQRGRMAPPPTPEYPTTVGEPTAANPSGITTTGVNAPRQGPVATPASYATNVSDAGGVQYNPAVANRITPPPLSPLQEASRASTYLPFATHPAKVQQLGQDQNALLRMGVEGRQGLVNQVIPQEDWNKPYVQDFILTGQMTGRMMTHFQKTNMVDPETGLPAIFNPNGAGYIDTNGNEVKNPVPYEKGTLIAYQGPKGEPLFGIERYQKLFDQNGNQLPDGTRKFYPSMAEQDRWNIVYKQVPQPDGRIALVPVLQRSGRTSPQGEPSQPGGAGPLSITPQGAGAIPSSKAAPVPSSNATPPKPKATPKVDPSTAMGLPKGSIIAGAKVPPGVAKAYETYNGSVSRYKIMEEAVPKALKGDQQAMINLLYNHIGMTTGLQKGARITKDLISEAENSAPWEATILKRIGIDKEFEITPDLLRGVVLDSTTMHNMVALAQDRVNQDYAAWQREITGAKTGYGMSTPPPLTSPDIGTASKPSGKPSTFKPF